MLCKALIIYHQDKSNLDSSDGIVSAWVAYQAKSLEYPPEDILVAAHSCNKEITDKEIAEIKDKGVKEIILTGILFDAEVINKLANFADVTVVEWQEIFKYNFLKLSDRIHQQFALSECAATLTWQCYFPDKKMPLLLEYIKDYKRRRFDFLRTTEINTAFNHLLKQFNQFGTLKFNLLFTFLDKLSLMNGHQLFEYLHPLGAKLIQAKTFQIKQIALRHQFNSFGIIEEGKDPLAVVVYLDKDGSEDDLVSDICEELFCQFSDAPFTACYLPSILTWELRSNPNGNNTDVGAIARQFGGEGNHNAARFKVKYGKSILSSQEIT